MRERVFLPSDLLLGIDRSRVIARRLLVTMAVLGDAKMVQAAWPFATEGRPDEVSKPGSVTVVSALLELKNKGVVTDISEAKGGFWVSFSDRREVAA